jgi:hypothetical protein
MSGLWNMHFIEILPLLGDQNICLLASTKGFNISKNKPGLGYKVHMQI